jgi:tRNA threonylcarbamoyladenosine biosynthesis protein TsaB
MIHILHLETSSKNCSVSVGTNGRLISLCEEVSPDFKHSENLHLFVQWALEGAELELEDIHAVSVGKGPGSYTGLRIGTAAAKGFCFGKDIPLISVNSLYLLAFSFFNSEYDYIIPVMDARRMEVYTAVFNRRGKIEEKTRAHILNENSFEKYRSEKVLFIGDAVEKTKKFFKETLQELPDLSFKLFYPSAKDMTAISFEKFQINNFEDTAYFDPLYLKDWK